PFPRFPLNLPITPDATLCGVALLLAIASGLLFGAVPVRQGLETDPYTGIKTGPTSGVGRRLSVREHPPVAAIALCALLVTCSGAAVRGLTRSMHGHYGFDVQDRMVAGVELHIAGYRPETFPAIQRRMVDAMASIPGVRAVGTTDCIPLSQGDVPGT